ncbi:uncharacterized protein PADG_11501 [Paracoccidioides brasiliensis Pb18]|uniref:Uncharacterized protein n=1 Tax=Paracoccidioides brasiliensis (strain Pb18) TaxID=502780 RepID=A0A0A0HY77_PARBD|nr:uncharacterized protein PADG_11501 [Paracoccidioides brasiliensis Pb18]KGM92310.1 hypothetical protein PADG_11501 [Paracoccidioides brasiliensis Pb18]
MGSTNVRYSSNVPERINDKQGINQLESEGQDPQSGGNQGRLEEREILGRKQQIRHVLMYPLSSGYGEEKGRRSHRDPEALCASRYASGKKIKLKSQ